MVALADSIVEHDRLDDEPALSRVQTKLSGQISCPQRGSFNFLDRGVDRRHAVEIRKCDLDTAENANQHVLKLVRDPTSQRRQALQFLKLLDAIMQPPSLIFERFAGGDIAHHAQGTNLLPVVIVHRLHEGKRGKYRAIPPYHLNLAREIAVRIPQPAARANASSLGAG
jgi:hypothetical protein